MNWYVYANNNPIMFIDPFGLAPGDFMVNGNVIGNTSKWNTGTYGNARDYVVAMGGQVVQQGNSSVYDFNIGSVSFSIDTATIGSYGKVKASRMAHLFNIQ